jgi:hypothetical protein
MASSVFFRSGILSNLENKKTLQSERGINSNACEESIPMAAFAIPIGITVQWLVGDALVTLMANERFDAWMRADEIL